MAANDCNNEIQFNDQLGIGADASIHTDDLTDTVGWGGVGRDGGASTSAYQQDALSNYHKYAAKMVTDRHAAEYNMRHKNCGEALIFNHEFFDDDERKLKDRTGTNVDCANLETVLKKLNFQVTVYPNLRYAEIISAVRYAASLNHEDNDCILIVILSHGDKGCIDARDVQYKLDTIWSQFTPNKCPTLAGKPKLFFVQACRGTDFNPGVTLQRGNIETDGDSSMSYKIPMHADFLIAYSTIPGFYSWRNGTNGSWFIQSLCVELAANGKRLDILTLLTFVCQRVAIHFESNIPLKPEMHQQKQTPCFATMLTRTLIFTDKPNHS